MLVEKDSYKKNKKTGNIVKRQVVSVKCDSCGRVWESLYDNRKRKKIKEDLCKSCRSRFKLVSQESLSKRRWNNVDSKVEVICSFCEKSVRKYPSMIHKNRNNFCDKKCRDRYVLKKYDILYETFNNNIDEVAYLFGLVLGDGHLRKIDQKNTTRIDIAFNLKEVNMIELAKSIMEKLKIKFYPQIEKNSNCLHLGFVLPDDLLKKYNMLWEGSKFNANPNPIDEIINNINVIIGLVNSDGHCVKRKEKIKSIRFTNTVESIFNVFVKCLDFYNISYSTSEVEGRIDRRTGNKNKNSFRVGIGVKGVNEIFSMKKYALKGQSFEI
jgi:hypothetical protein